MATAANSYFEKRKAAGTPVVSELPKFDLDIYIANYTGRTRIVRLLFIARTSPPLSKEALKFALIEAKRGRDVQTYRTLVDTLHQIWPEEAQSQLDDAWIEQVSKAVKADADRLEFELKGSKNTLIKESIRMCNEDLGTFYLQSGELGQATKAIAGMREYCTAPKHIAEMYLHLVEMAIEQGDWLSVQSHSLKSHNLNLRAEHSQNLLPKLTLAGGLAYICQGNYRDAANIFIATDPAIGNTFNNVMTMNDIAIYGGLCALASFRRTELQTSVLDNANFRSFLELEPHIRRAITLFCNSKYAQCLEILEAYRTDYLLDLHLQGHVHRIYQAIRSKSIVQYFIPFSTVTMANMASVFATAEDAMERELVDMIKRDDLPARIDTQNRLLVRKQVNARHVVHKETLSMVMKYERTARLRLMRMNIIAAGLEVRGPKEKPGRDPEYATDNRFEVNDGAGNVLTSI